MSRDNVEIIRAALEAYNRGDFDAALEHAAPDFVLDMTRAVGLQNGVYTLDQIRDFWSEFDDIWESLRVEPQEFIEAGEHVVVPWIAYATGRGGIEVSSRVAWLFTFRDGTVLRTTMYQERQDALDALGLPASAGTEV